MFQKNGHLNKDESEIKIFHCTVYSNKWKMAKHWSLDLYREIEDPNNIVLSSSQSVVLKDAFPKAIHHYLVLPKYVKIKDVFQLSIDHLPLLDDMFQLAKKLVNSLRMQPKEFLIGFKLDPSMELLHLHVISTDFKSKHLKNDRHWTTFHTKIFLPYDAAYDQLQNNGNIEHLTEDELNKARLARLKCNSCEFSTTILFDLKKHLFKHGKKKRIPRVFDGSWRCSQMGPFFRNHPTLVGQRTEVASAQRNASLELPQSSSNIKPQPSLKERVEALNKMLEIVSITTTETTPTTSETATTTEPISNCDMKIDYNIVDPGLNKDLRCDPETLEHKDKVCEQQQKQENGTSTNVPMTTHLSHGAAAQQNVAKEFPQTSSNVKPKPSLKERVEALNKMLETVSITNSNTNTTKEPISNCDMQIDQNIVEPSLNKHLECDQEAFEQKENVCERQQEQQNEALESSQNTSNSNPQSSLKERFEVLNKMLDTVSIKTTETTD